MARGRYSGSLALTYSLTDDQDCSLCARSLGYSARASILRQVGSPHLARANDRSALDLVADLPDSAARRIALADATAGLAADAIALGDVVDLDALLAIAGDAAAARGDWRVQTRLSWVQAEAALVRGLDARTYAQRAVEASSGRSFRHRVKSHLIRGVAGAAVGDVTSAVRDLRVVAAAPYPPLHWATAAVVADLRLRTRWSRAVEVRGLRAVRSIAADLPAELRQRFLASARPSTLRGPLG